MSVCYIAIDDGIGQTHPFKKKKEEKSFQNSFKVDPTNINFKKNVLCESLYNNITQKSEF